VAGVVACPPRGRAATVALLAALLAALLTAAAGTAGTAPAPATAPDPAPAPPDPARSAPATPARTTSGARTDTATVARPDLGGVWSLDAARSDDLAGPLERLAEQLAARPGGPGTARPSPSGPRGAPGGGPPVGGPGRGRSVHPPAGGPADGGAPDLAAAARRLDRLARAQQLLLIIQEAGHLEIMDGNDRSATWHWDGGAPTDPPGRADAPGPAVRRTAWWEGATLVLQTVGPRLTVRRRLTREVGGEALGVDVEVRVRGQRRPVSARLVYTGA
jgi:hypothetical protein